MRKQDVAILALGSNLDYAGEVARRISNNFVSRKDYDDLAERVSLTTVGGRTWAFREALTTGKVPPPAAFVAAEERMLMALDDEAEILLDEIWNATHGGDGDFSGKAPSVLRMCTAVGNICRKAGLSRVGVFQLPYCPPEMGLSLKRLDGEGIERCDFDPEDVRMIMSEARKIALIDEGDSAWPQAFEGLWRALQMSARRRDIQAVVMTPPRLANLDWSRHFGELPMVIDPYAAYAIAASDWAVRCATKV